jgi:three-Cys-motif partner protein
LFTGDSAYLCNGVDCSLEGSALRALKSAAKFARYGFLTPSRSVAANLKTVIMPLENASQAEILTGNPNKEKTLSHLLDNLPRSASGLIFIEPHGYRRLNFSTLEKLILHAKNWQNQKVELLIIFPLEMALLRNLLRPECADSLTAFFGNRLWEDVRRQIQMRKKASPDDIKYELVELYKNNLRNLGYRYVEDFKPASPTPNPYYHLIYAGDVQNRRSALKDAFGKPRFLRCELLYRPKGK